MAHHPNAAHIPKRVDRNADLANFATRKRMIGVITVLRRQIECYVDSCQPSLEHVPEPPIGFPGAPEPRVLTHRPEPALIHGWIDAAGERKLARQPDVAQIVEPELGEMCRCIDASLLGLSRRSFPGMGRMMDCADLPFFM